MRLRELLTAAAFAASVAASTDAAAANFVVIRDTTGDIADPDGPSLGVMRTRLLEAYEAQGLELPEVLSVWTTFPMNGSNFGTYIDLRANDVSGIGFEDVFAPDGLKESNAPPLRAVLWHSNMRALDQRAALHKAPLDGYGRYLFLLELSHLWGPDISAPDPGPTDLVGFPFHWSYFLDCGGGPAGGNVWTDNGDGTFTVVPGDPATVAYSDLDLYLLGLAEPEEVGPFGVLLPTDIPTTPTDPFWGGTYAPRSFPWFDQEAEPMTVTATRRELTIDDVIAANGARDPGAGVKTSFTLGIVLVVEPDADDATVEGYAEEFAPLADSLSPAFNDATSGRGTLEVVTVIEEEGGGGAGGGGTGGASEGGAPEGGASEGGAGATDDGGESGGCDCSTSSSTPRSAGALLMLLAAATLRSARRAKLSLSRR